MLLFLIHLFGGYIAAGEIGLFKEQKGVRLFLCIFAGWVFIIIWAISFLSDDNSLDRFARNRERNLHSGNSYSSNTSNGSSDNTGDGVACPYCHTRYAIDSDGYYVCSNCKKFFRYKKGKIYKEEETVNELEEILVKSLAYVSKADGRVTENEVEFIQTFLVDQLEYNKDQQKYCAEVFNSYKKIEFNVYNFEKEIKEVGFNETKLDENFNQAFKEILILMAFIDGEMTQNQYNVIYNILKCLNIECESFQQIKNNYYEQNPDKDLKKCYEILGVEEGADMETIKNAYRKLVKMYHPDVLRSKNLSPEAMKEVTKKFQAIQHAYEQLSKQYN